MLLSIIEWLQALGLVAGDGVDAFRDVSPEKPDNIVVLHEYQGGNVVQYETAMHRSVQVTVRNTSAGAAKTKAWEIFKTMQAVNGVFTDLTASRKGVIYLRQPPIKIKEDSLGRIVWGFNIGITTNSD